MKGAPPQKKMAVVGKSVKIFLGGDVLLGPRSNAWQLALGISLGTPVQHVLYCFGRYVYAHFFFPKRYAAQIEPHLLQMEGAKAQL